MIFNIQPIYVLFFKINLKLIGFDFGLILIQIEKIIYFVGWMTTDRLFSR